MKKIIIFVVAIAALFIIPPYFVGSTTEIQFNKYIAQSNKHPSFSLKVTEYNKGWFSSTAKIEFEINMPLDPELSQLPKIVFVQEMQHGPLLWKAEDFGLGLVDSIVTVELPAEWQEMINKVESINEDTLSLTSRTAFDGSTNTYLDIAKITYEDETVDITLKPTKATIYYNLAGKMTGSFDWQGMKISENGKQIFIMGAITSELDQQLVRGELFAPDAIFSGMFNANVTSVSILPKQAAGSVQLADLNFSGKSIIHEEAMDVDVVFSIAKINAMKLEFTDYIQDMSFLNLDITAMQELNNLIMLVQTDDQQDPELTAAAMLQEAQKVLPKLLAANPEFKVNSLGITTNEGKIDTRLDVHINSDVYDPANPETLMMSIEAKASGEAPEAFFTQFGLAAPINQFVQQNMITREDNLLKFNVKFTNGQATLNGNPIPLGGM